MDSTSSTGIAKINTGTWSISNLVPSDIPTLLSAKISDFDSQARSLLSVALANGLSYNNVNGEFSLVLSDNATTGALSNTDWTSFNAKVDRVGDSMTGNLLFGDALGIDSVNLPLSVLNIATNYATTVNMGTSPNI
jgi:hypothetical protein